MNKKQLVMFILWIALVIGLVLFAIIYVIIAQSKQASINDVNNQMTQILYLLTMRRF